METGPSAQSPFQKPNFGTSGQKLRKIRYQSFLVISNLAYFFELVLNVLFAIVGIKSREMGRNLRVYETVT